MVFDPTKISSIAALKIITSQQSSYSSGMVPYINRIKKESVRVLCVGVGDGENESELIDRCQNIKTLYCVKGPNFDQNMFEKNLSIVNMKVRFVSEDQEDEYDVVIIDRTMITVESLSKYYKRVINRGIFSGTEYDSIYVKDALKTFRRNEKIGSPINLSKNFVWFFHKF